MQTYNTRRGPLTLVSSCSPQELAGLGIDSGLGFFWHNRPDLQHKALIKISEMPQGQVAVAYTTEKVIVGYVTINLPEADTRWGRDEINGLLEMGGIEVSRDWRGTRVGHALLASVFTPESFKKNIVVATGYRWCWDTDSTGLTGREYRDLLHKMFQRYGFELYETDEPNIAWYPDNGLVVRIGSEVSHELLAKFKSLLFERPGSDYVPGEFAR